MAYQIECVIQELGLEVKGCVSSLKIKGTEGFLLKQGTEEYNVFCSEKMPTGNDIASGALILNAKTVLNCKYTVCYGIAQILSQAKISNSKVRLVFENIIPCNVEKEKSGVIISLPYKSICSSISLI